MLPIVCSRVPGPDVSPEMRSAGKVDCASVAKYFVDEVLAETR